MNSDRVIALGYFDGVHLGHGALLQKARQRANELGCQAAAFTFDPHPDTLIHGNSVPLINTLSDRQWLMTQLYAIDEVLVLQFDQAFMHMPWETFVKDVLIGRFHAVHVVCGYDYHFGYRGQGSASRLQALGATLGLGCDVIEPVTGCGAVISSTRIRSLLASGALEDAAQLLGHPHFFSGTVVHGRGMGHQLGFPTANLTLPPGVLELPHGVYATRVLLPDQRCYVAVTNLGMQPTVSDSGNVAVESWLLDYSGDLYGAEIQVQFFQYLRPVQQFASLDALTAAVRHDGETARAYFRNHHK